MWLQFYLSYLFNDVSCRTTLLEHRVTFEIQFDEVNCVRIVIIGNPLSNSFWYVPWSTWAMTDMLRILCFLSIIARSSSAENFTCRAHTLDSISGHSISTEFENMIPEPRSEWRSVRGNGSETQYNLWVRISRHRNYASSTQHPSEIHTPHTYKTRTTSQTSRHSLRRPRTMRPKNKKFCKPMSSPNNLQNENA